MCLSFDTSPCNEDKSETFKKVSFLILRLFY